MILNEPILVIRAKLLVY